MRFPSKRITAAVLGLGLLAGAAYAARSFIPRSAPAYDGQPNRYRVTLDAKASTAHIEADLWMPSPALSLFGVMPSTGLPNGQAEFLEHLEVTGREGKKLSIKDLGQGDYELGEAGRVQLRYDVRLEHDRHPWPAGVEEVAYHTDEGLMATGYALFLAPGDQMQGAIEVELQLPEGWQARTPWQSEGGNRFRVDSRRQLLSNALFLGTAHAETVRMGGVELTLVLGRRYVPQKDLMLTLLKPQMDGYLALFGRKPLSERYLIVVNQGDSGDGGAFSGSFSQFIAGDADPSGRVVWGYVMSHELLHFWNGLSLVPADEREEWFKEGVTDYLTVVTLAQNGLIDDPLLFKRIENWPRRYLIARIAQRLGMSVREAGKDKQPNRQLVYGGGSLTALALDVELRKQSGDKVGLPELMRAMYAELGRPGKTYSLADIERHAKALTGGDFRTLFAKAVESQEYFDIRPYLKDLGLRLDSFLEEMYLTRDPAAGPAEQARFQAVFGPR